MSRRREQIREFVATFALTLTILSCTLCIYSYTFYRDGATAVLMAVLFGLSSTTFAYTRR